MDVSEIIKQLSQQYGFDTKEAELVIKNAVDRKVKENEQCITSSIDKTPNEIMLGCIEEEVFKEEKDNIWSNSIFEKINRLKPNNSGNVGELFLYNYCVLLGMEVEYRGSKNKNAVDGTYDIKINGYRVEVKTARVSKKTGSFQHESLRNLQCDFYTLIDILPNYWYLTIIPSFDLSTKNTILEKKPHLRKGTTNVYKLDLTEKILNKSIQKGYTVKILPHSNSNIIQNLIQTVISNTTHYT